MWVKKDEWQGLCQSLKTVNHELGTVQNDMKWVKYLLGILITSFLATNALSLLKLFGVI